MFGILIKDNLLRLVNVQVSFYCSSIIHCINNNTLKLFVAINLVQAGISLVIMQLLFSSACTVQDLMY